MSLRMLPEIEQRIIRRLVSLLIEQGRFLTVFDGEEEVVKRTLDAERVLRAVGATDVTTLIASAKDSSSFDGKVILVHGNEAEVIADCSIALEGTVNAVLREEGVI